MSCPLSKKAVVGRMYWVPCLKLDDEYQGESWIPVIGQKHSDAELGVTFDHYHIDWRFVPQRFFAMSLARSAIAGKPHQTVISNTTSGRWPHKIDRRPVLKLRKCRREMPDFPASPKKAFSDLESSMIESGARLVRGHVCPHRGFDLRAFDKGDGTAVCPGHGIHWNLKTGEIIPRHSVVTA